MYCEMSGSEYPPRIRLNSQRQAGSGPTMYAYLVLDTYCLTMKSFWFCVPYIYNREEATEELCPGWFHMPVVETNTHPPCPME